ncbi:MAG: YicC family protein [Gemmatimonadaceae bacterium]|nr:YicC family protein [Gemmatimonadaceae bacterium]MCW5825206.1 YicC family protein [Gemmatimonadaceae bacterium]
MTGFGAAEGPIGGSRVSVELRSVNHRFFNPSLKLPQALGKWEPEVRETLRQRITRGHVTLSVRVVRDDEAASVVDEARFAAAADALKALQTKYGLGGAVDVATVLRMPEVLQLTRDDAGLETATSEELQAVVEAAVDALQTMRASEGARLAQVIDERLNVVEAAVARIAARAPERVIAQRDRLRENVERLAGGIAVDPQRLAQEIAILADRLDVGEELDRFGSHIAAFREALASKTGDGVGKRLGFLLQELLREANTTGSKANDAAMLQDVVAIKEELERIREQVENVE